MPLRAFARGTRLANENPELSLQFRSLPKRDLETHEPTYEWVSTFVDAALKVLPVRENLPAWFNEFPRGPSESYLEAEVLADRFRTKLVGNSDAPLYDLAAILEKAGGFIVSQISQSKYEGASVSAGGYIFIFVSPRFAGRMLFTLAHELGHALARHLDQAPLFERAKEIGTGRNKSERYVDAFASCLLLPTQAVARALFTIRRVVGNEQGPLGDIELLYLARFFGVSFETAAWRCENLDLLPPGGAASLAEYLKKGFKSPEKRADELGLPPRPDIHIPRVSPTLLGHALKGAAADRVSVSWLADRFGLSVEQLYKYHAMAGDGRANNT